MPLRNKPPKKKHSPKNTPIQYADFEKEQEYARIVKALGNCHFRISNISGKERVASTSGCAKKKGRIQNGQLVLIEPLSEDTDKKWQIIFKYSPQHEKILDREGHLNIIELNNNDSDVSEEESDFMFEGEQEQENNNVLDIDETFVDNI